MNVIQHSFRTAVTPEMLMKPELPLKQVSESKYLSQLQERRDKLHKSLKESLVCLDLTEFIAGLKVCKNEDTEKQKLNKEKEELQKNKAQPAEIEAAEAAVKQAEQATHVAVEACQQVAESILDQDITQEFLSSENIDLYVFMILKQATPKQLANWCDQSDENATQLSEFLDNPELIKLFMASGGARNHQYGKALQIYHNIQPDHPVLKRLALAVALELCEPYRLFQESGVVNPYKRYVHYEQAYCRGELDPSFSQFSIWELRKVVDSDATEEELTSGRTSLRNYRPDLVGSDNSQWRYCEIVRSDVSYKAPDWYKKPRSYDQILSGGGKCGPRAWYGRFICKAFGIPTWGCRQPGHAAMTRWTSNGWCVCLGGGIHKSYWEGQHGQDFVLETRARSAVSDQEYLKKVIRLELVAMFHNENLNPVRGEDRLDPNSPYYTLAKMQRSRLAKSCSNKLKFECTNLTPNQIHVLKDRKDNEEDIVIDDNVVTIPAACTASSKQANLIKSFLGGKQLYVHHDAVLSYDVPKDLVGQERQLSCMICTVHRNNDKVLLLTTASTEYKIQLPYTMGHWQVTEPVTVKLGEILSFSRPNQPHGFALKNIRLLV